MAPETLGQRAATLAQLELLLARRGCGHDERTAVRDRDDPLAEAGAAGNQLAKAPESFIGPCALRRCDRLVEAIGLGPLAIHLALCTDRPPAVLRAMRAPEIKRVARRDQRDLAKNGPRHKFKRCFKFLARAIRARQIG